METTPVKTREQLHFEWVHRPQELRQYSFEEWKAGRELREENAERVTKEAWKDGAAVSPDAEIGRSRHETAKMNKLETKYSAHLELRKTTGEIVEWRFEPMKLRLAPRTYFDIDFIVIRRWRMNATNFDLVELHEVKGHWEDDARVKMKVSATMFPWWKFKGVQWDKEAKDWKFEEFNP